MDVRSVRSDLSQGICLYCNVHVATVYAVVA